jgi:hypothetical protein
MKIEHAESKIKPMKMIPSVFGGVLLFASVFLNAQEAPHFQQKPAPIYRKVYIDPGSTSVSLGKVSLNVSPLSHVGKFFTGGYAIKVTPYFYKSEKGALELEAAEDIEQKLSEGVPVKFIGKAINVKNGKTKVVVGKATPSGKDQGWVTFSIETTHGMMIFNTTYHLAE